MVLITLFTTVYPTDLVQATMAPSVSSTTAISSSATLSSGMPDPTISISSVNVPSQTLLPTSSVTGIPFAPKQKFNDTFAYVILTALIALALLLIAMVLYMICLRCKGQCPQCHSLKQQLSKWKSGELRHITPLMVMKREALKETPSSSNTSSEVDVEMGFVGRRMSRAAAVDQLEANKKLSLFQKAKAKIARIDKSITQVPASSTDNVVDRFFTVNEDATINNPSPFSLTTHELPQAGYDADCLYATCYSAYPTSSTYSQPIDVCPTGVNESRVFRDVSTLNISNIRGSLRKDSDEPKRYTAYAPETDHNPYDSRQKEHSIAGALAKLESREYKEAESVLKRHSARDSEMRRATSLVNLRDKELHIARYPSMYPEACIPLDQSAGSSVPVQLGDYRVLDWREKKP